MNKPNITYLLISNKVFDKIKLVYKQFVFVV